MRNQKIILISVSVLSFLVIAGSAFATLTINTDTITGSGALNLNPTGQPVTVNGDMTVNGHIDIVANDNSGIYSIGRAVEEAGFGYGLAGEAYTSETGDHQSAWGMWTYAENSSSGVLHDGIGLYIYPPTNWGGGSIVNAFGIYIDDFADQGSITGENYPINYANKFMLDIAGNIQLGAVNTTAPAAGDCNAAEETGKVYWDSTNDNIYICSGASGWRKIATTAP